MSKKMMIEALYEEYTEGNAKLKSEYNDQLKKVSAALDEKLSAGKLTTTDLADYEEATAHAAFYAGVKAAVNFLKEAME